jgi:chromosome segregation ATPase
MTSQLDGESLCREIEALNEEIRKLEKQKKECMQKIIELRNQENPAEGKFFPEKIFALQQEKLRLEVEIDLRRKKINRLTYKY